MAPPYTTGLILSLDAALGVYKDAAKSAAATTAGDLVFVWADQSGAGNDVIQATSGSRPTFQTGVLNSLPIVRFANPTTLSAASGLSLSSQGQTVFLVLRPAARNQVQTFLGQNAQNMYQTSGNFSVYDGANTRTVANGSMGPQRDFQALAIVFNTTSITWRQNGGASGYSATTLQAAATTLTSLFLGSNSTPGQYWSGDIAEALVYNAALSCTNLTSVENYLLAKYAIPSPLPTNAPLVVVEGDSLSEGVNTLTNMQEYPEIAYQGASGASPYNYRNLAVSGSQVSDLTNRASTLDALYSSARSKNILYVWVGTNDLANAGLTPTVAYNNLVTYCQARRTAGWKVIVRTMVPRASYSNTNRLSYNSLIRGNWQTFADGLDDLGNDTILGQAGVQSNTSYYSGDQIHLTPAGYGIAATYAGAAITKLTFQFGRGRALS